MPRRRDVDGQRAALSAATWAVLAEQGLAGLTLRAVAERAGCSTGLVLHAFPGKRALLVHARELLHRRSAERAEAAEAAAQAAGADPWEVLRAALVQALVVDERTREDARVWTGFLAAAVADPELAALHAAHHLVFVRRVERLLARCRPDLPPGRRTDEAVALVALVEGVTALAGVDPATYPARRQRAAVDLALERSRAAAPRG
ncbi:TetR/AcrR family transcriptional regulator [Kineococcus sp. SYSU DK006]|uniref:TetR/AcrR family transcriptional regulator n=1 Tax=Kineococcus sp. SYSU DK006 TaxID=3383127 RepID=UPI003D7D26FF